MGCRGVRFGVRVACGMLWRVERERVLYGECGGKCLYYEGMVTHAHIMRVSWHMIIL